MSSSAINHLDWSLDSEKILWTNTGYEIRAFRVSGTELTHETRLSNLKDEDWKTWSLNLGWPVQGIYGRCIDLTEINTVERSHGG